MNEIEAGPVSVLALEIDNNPRAIEQRLTAAIRSVARRSLSDPKVTAALAAAESIPAGIVLTSEDAAANVVDLMRTIIDGEKVLAADLKEILRIPAAMEDAARQAIANERGDLVKARDRGNDARVAYQALLRRRAAEAEARAREDARKATEAAAAAAIEMGDDIPPEPELAPIPVPRTVAAGKAKSGTMVKARAVMVVDYAACPVEWLRLDTALALVAFNGACAAGITKKPEPGESIVWRGVKFEACEHAVNRS